MITAVAQTRTGSRTIKRPEIISSRSVEGPLETGLGWADPFPEDGVFDLVVARITVFDQPVRYDGPVEMVRICCQSTNPKEIGEDGRRWTAIMTTPFRRSREAIGSTEERRTGLDRIIEKTTGGKLPEPGWDVEGLVGENFTASVQTKAATGRKKMPSAMIEWNTIRHRVNKHLPRLNEL